MMPAPIQRSVDRGLQEMMRQGHCLIGGLQFAALVAGSDVD